MDSTRLRGIALYLEYQSVYSFVVIGSPRPLSRKQVSRRGTEGGGGGNTRLGVRGGGSQCGRLEKKAWNSVCSVVVVRYVCVFNMYPGAVVVGHVVVFLGQRHPNTLQAIK
jgi:hypothetical protein